MRRIARAPWQRPKPAVARHGSTIDPKLRDRIRQRADGRCDCCGDRLAPIFQAHHRKLLSRGGQDSAANLLALCRLCHMRCHSHVTWATWHGFIVAATDDPASVPVAVRGETWQLLGHDGTYQPAEAAS